MWRVICFLLFFGTLQITRAQDVNRKPEHMQWIASVIDSIHTIKPGMTRADLLKVFTTEGGMSTRQHRTYVYKGCGYIKVEVEFRPIQDTQSGAEMPTDRIISISQPFLEYSIAD